LLVGEKRKNPIFMDKNKHFVLENKRIFQKCFSEIL
jgi:hypothetical protein